MAKAAILGYGTVGSGTAYVLQTNEKEIEKRTGEKIELARILDIRTFPGDRNESLVTPDFDEILNDPEISVVAETMGGLKPAYEFTKKLLLAGKSVVTSNKELVSVHGPELFEIAKEKGVKYLFEASVGGGIPVIHPLINCLAANKIEEIKGILNGTTNYILTKMFAEGVDFDSALKDAMAKGYAEKDPTADIEGYDAKRKISILASIGCGKYIDPDGIHTEGISKIDKTDVEYAEMLGGKIKLMGFAKFSENGVTCSVEPSIVHCKSPIFAVDDVFNCVTVTGNAVGEVMFYGKGAGKEATASAVVSDIIDAVMDKSLSFPAGYEIADKSPMLPYGETVASYLVRFLKESEYNMEEISEIRKEDSRVLEAEDNEFAIITKEMTVAELDKKLSGYKVIKIIRICN